MLIGTKDRGSLGSQDNFSHCSFHWLLSHLSDCSCGILVLLTTFQVPESIPLSSGFDEYLSRVILRHFVYLNIFEIFLGWNNLKLSYCTLLIRSKGEQLKGKIVSAPCHNCRTFGLNMFIFFGGGGVIFQRDSKNIKKNKPFSR